MATTDKRFLEKHRQQWRVTVYVPVAARPEIGKAHLKEALGTANLTTANLLKLPVVARFKAQIEAALRGAQPSTALDEAQAIRAARRNNPKQSRLFTLIDHDERETDVEIEEDDEEYDAIRQAERLLEKGDEEAAVAFADIALSRGTPITDHRNAFVGDRDYQPKSLLELDRALDRLSEWLSSTRRKQTLEAVSPEVGRAYMRHIIHVQGLSPKSAAKYLSFLRSYWAWLAEHGHIPASAAPWAARLPKPKGVSRHTDQEPDEGKRPYTADEMTKLLKGPANADMASLIKFGALTGMRLEEIYRLRIRDVVDGFFWVRTGKTDNAKRRVPVHADLKDLVAGLVMDKKPESYLIDPQAPVIEKTGLRSGAASKAFGYYRKALGVDERPNDKLKSNVDFHSLRRWFIAQARDGLLGGATDYNMWSIADVVGHGDGLADTLRMTLGVYPGKSADAALKACVAAVQLPKGG